MRRPFVITLIALAVLSLAAYNAGRAIAAIRQYDLMHSLGLDAPQFALALTGIVWAIGFGAAAFGLYRLKPWARAWMLAAIVLYQANRWLLRLAFERSTGEPLTRPADATIALLSIVLVWAIALWPRVRRVFAKRDV
jgi:hypothetical protein